MSFLPPEDLNIVKSLEPISRYPTVIFNIYTAPNPCLSYKKCIKLQSEICQWLGSPTKPTLWTNKFEEEMKPNDLEI